MDISQVEVVWRYVDRASQLLIHSSNKIELGLFDVTYIEVEIATKIVSLMAVDIPHLLFDHRLSCEDTRVLSLSHGKPFSFWLRLEDEAAVFQQGIAWRPNRIRFDLGTGNTWTTICLAERIAPNVLADRSLLVPWTVPEIGQVSLHGELDSFSFEVPSGCYALLCERWFLQTDELNSHKKYSPFIEELSQAYYKRPELCKLTFVPAQESVAPEVFRYLPEANAPDQLILFDDAVEDAARYRQRPRTAKEEAFVPKRKRQSPSWLPYLRSDLQGTSLEEALETVLKGSPGEHFRLEDFTSQFFDESIPRPDFLKARNQISNWLNAGVRAGKWRSRQADEGSSARLYSYEGAQE